MKKFLSFLLFILSINVNSTTSSLVKNTFTSGTTIDSEKVNENFNQLAWQMEGRGVLLFAGKPIADISIPSPSTLVSVVFGTRIDSSDLYNVYNTTTGKFTAPSTGLYKFQVIFVGVTHGMNNIKLKLNNEANSINGVVFENCAPSTNIKSFEGCNYARRVLYLQANDQIEIQIYSESLSQDISATHSRLYIEKL